MGVFLTAALRSFRAHLRAGLRTSSVYLADCAVGLLTYPVELAITFLMWNLFLGAGDGGMAARDVLAYYAVMLLVNRAAPSRFISLRLEQQILGGGLAVQLARPSVPWAAIAGREMAPTLLNLAVLTPLAALVSGCLLGRMPGLAGFALWMSVAVLLQSLVRLIVGTAAFWMLRIVGLVHTVEFLMRLASGGVLPLGFFPVRVEQALGLTPFPLLLYVPVQAMLGKLDSATAAGQLVTAACWFPLLLGAFLALWGRGVRRFSGHGV